MTNDNQLKLYDKKLVFRKEVTIMYPEIQEIKVFDGITYISTNYLTLRLKLSYQKYKELVSVVNDYIHRIKNEKYN